MPKFKERRSRLRIDYRALITICIEGQPAITGECTNVSMDGVFVLTTKKLAVGSKCGVKIALQGPSSTLTIDIKGTVSRSSHDSLAIQFQNNLEWWAIFTIYTQYSGNQSTDSSLCSPEIME